MRRSGSELELEGEVKLSLKFLPSQNNNYLPENILLQSEEARDVSVRLVCVPQ